MGVGGGTPRATAVCCPRAAAFILRRSLFIPDPRISCMPGKTTGRQATGLQATPTTDPEAGRADKTNELQHPVPGLLFQKKNKININIKGSAGLVHAWVLVYGTSLISLMLFQPARTAALTNAGFNSITLGGPNPISLEPEGRG